MEALIIVQMVSDDHILEKTFEHGPGKMLQIKAEGAASGETLRQGCAWFLTCSKIIWNLYYALIFVLNLCPTG